MKILFLSTWHPYPPDNGSKLRAYYLLQALARNHSVTLVTFDPEGMPTRKPAAERQIGRVRVCTVAADPFRLVGLPTIVKFLSPIPLSSWPQREMRQCVAALAHAEPWDSVVAIQTPVAQYAVQLRSAGRVFDIDVALSNQMLKRYRQALGPLNKTRTWLSYLKTRAYERRMLRRFQVSTVVSPLEVDYLRSLAGTAPTQVAMIPNGVDCLHNQPGLTPSLPNRLVYNGAITYSANHDAMRWFLAEVYPLIKDQLPDVSLVITGSTKGVDLSGLALDDSITLTGHVQDVRIPVSEATACVAPIRDGGGTRLKILEALALGTPVVATTTATEGLNLTPGEHLLVADEPEDFARCTVMLLSDADMRERLANEARRLVETHYDWASIGKRFEELVIQTTQHTTPGKP